MSLLTMVCAPFVFQIDAMAGDEDIAGDEDAEEFTRQVGTDMVHGYHAQGRRQQLWQEP